jgi:hypothetical protein
MVQTPTGGATELLSRFKAEHRIVQTRPLTVDERERFNAWLVRNGHHSQALSEPRSFRYADGDKILSRLAPDWNRRRKIVQTRMKTMLRIYLSKWFWDGLEWNEAELVLLLLERLKVDHNLDSNALSQRTGISLFAEQYAEEERKGIYSKGTVELENTQILELLYDYQDYKAVWKLRSVQSLRDFLFVKVTGHEHEGKRNITKPRIRGYRDGKGKAGDPTRIKLALEVDRLFYQEQSAERWAAFDLEISRLIRT